VSKRQIEERLRKALLQDGNMAHALYEFELEEHRDYWYQGLQNDGDEFVFAVTENSGDVAMVLITEDKTVYVNEEARDKLSELWPQAYRANMERLIPMMAQELADGTIAVNGVKTVCPEDLWRFNERV
jgi:hypothetical protein